MHYAISFNYYESGSGTQASGMLDMLHFHKIWAQGKKGYPSVRISFTDLWWRNRYGEYLITQ